VIRQIGVKPAYSPQELNKGFLCVRVEPDMSVEEARRRGMASAAQIFGAATQPVAALPMPDFSQATEVTGPDDNGDDSGEAEGVAISEPEASGPEGPQGDGSLDRLPMAGEQAAPQQGGARKCDLCDNTVSAPVVRYCQSPAGAQRFGGAVLCLACQKKGGA
jgi:hypothetical protein